MPAAAFAERDGSYVNRHDRLQTVGLGDPPALGRAARGRVVLGTAAAGRGLYNSRGVLDEIAREILYFSAAAGPIPEWGWI